MATRNGTVRVMWRVGGALLALLTLFWLGLEALEQLTWHTEVQRQTIDADRIATVLVELDSGSATVTGKVANAGEATTISTKATLRVGLTEANYTVKREGTSLIIDDRCGWLTGSCVERLDLTVPAGVVVRATTSNGDLRATGLDGEVTLRSDNGAITATDIAGPLTMASDNGDLNGRELDSGEVDARSANGQVRLSLSEVPTEVKATSDNDDVEITLPRSADTSGIDFAVTASSDNGEVSTPIRTNSSSDRSIIARADNGDVTIRYGQ